MNQERKDKAPKDAEPRGLVCRECGCRHFWVVYTRAYSGGRVVRRRECRHCGRRMTTWEKMVD
jgi:transcriptional regulator NrdR family protein